MSTQPAARSQPSDPDDRRTRYEAVFGAVYESVQRYVRRRCPAASADDVISEVLLVVWRRLDEVPADAAVAWTYGVARRCLANERRGSRRRLALVSRVGAQTPPGDEPAAATASDDHVLHEALTRLSDDDRELVRLWAWEGLEPRELAVALGITPNAASIRLHRARARLADHLQEER